MILFVFLLISEVLTLAAIRDLVRMRSRSAYFLTVILHVVLSLWLWRLLFEVVTYDHAFDNARHIWLLMNLAGTIAAVFVPRVILILTHYTGKLIKIRKGGYLGWLSATGFIIAVMMFSVIALGTLYGRFNFRTEYVEIKLKGLSKDLDGLKIVQISDLHLASFYNHPKSLQKVMHDINNIKPDLILNTGDFVTFGWQEFGRNDTILAKAKSRYGNFAVLGNHDFGTYDPFFTEADRNNNVLNLNNLVKSSGYYLLSDTSKVVKINNARIGLIGIITKGRHPDILHGNLTKAVAGLDSVDLKILLSHDPNQWEEEVVGKTDIDITLSGHTHGMQMGIYTKWLKWSPSKYFYPHWSGLFREGKQVQYVNRGLGELAIPFRIWMPPEITVITLSRE
jgi:predicted MPP superfamily phosphohydrolase